MAFETPSKAPQSNPAKAVEEFFEAFKSKEYLQEKAQDFERFVHKHIEKLATKEELEELQRRIENGIEVPEIFRSSEAREVLWCETQNRLGVVMRSIEKWYKPSTWSPETRKMVPWVGAGVFAGIVIGGILFGRAAWRKTREVAGKVKRGMSRVKKTVLWMLGGAALLVGGYFGVRAAQKWMGIRELQKKIEDMSNKIASIPEEMRGEAEEELKQMREQLEKLKKGEEVAEEKPAKEEDEVVDQEGSADEGDDRSLNKAVEKMARTGSYYALASSLVSFEDSADWEDERKTKVQHINDFLSDNENIDMDTIFEAIKKDGSVDTSRLVWAERDPESRKQAALFVAGFCREKRDELLDKGHTRSNLMSESLKDYIRLATPGYKEAGSIIRNIQDADGNLIEALKKPISGAEKTARVEFESFIDEHSDKLEEGSKLRINDLLENMADLSISVEAYLAKSTEDTDPVLREVCNAMKKDTHEYILPFFHSLFPSHKWDKEHSKNVEHVKDVLYSKMPLSKAIRLYFYRRMMERGNPSGVILAQSDVFSYFVQHDDSFLGRKKYKLMNRIADVIAGGTWEEWQDAEVPVDEEMIDKAIKGMGVVSTSALGLLLRKMGSGIQEAAGFLIGSTEERPILLGAPLITAASGYALYRSYRFERSAAPDQVELRLEKAENGRSVRRKLVKRAKSVEFSTGDWQRGRKTFSVIRAKIKKLTELGNIPGSEGLIDISNKFDDALMRCTTSSLRDSFRSWDEFVRTVEKHRGVDTVVDELYDQAKAVRDNKKLREVISVASRPILGRVRRVAQWLGARKMAVENFALKQYLDPKVDTLLRRIAYAHKAGDVGEIRNLLSNGLFRDRLVRDLAEEGSENAVALLKIKDVTAEELAGKPLSDVFGSPIIERMDEVRSMDVARVEAAKGTLGVRTLKRAQETAVIDAAYAPPSQRIGILKGAGFADDEIVRLAQNGVVEEIAIPPPIPNAPKGTSALSSGKASKPPLEEALERRGKTPTPKTRKVSAVEHFDESKAASTFRRFEGSVDEFLDLAKQRGVLDVDTVVLISESGGARKIMAGAIEAGKEADDVAEISRALRIANKAKNLRVGMNTLGAAGDVLAVLMAIADIAENEGRIENAKQTGNKALLDLYKNANYLYVAEGAEGIAGITIGGIAIAKATLGGQSLFTALGASGGLIMLPIAVATMSGRFIYKKAERVAEEWLKTAKDWQKTATPPELMLELKKLGPGKRDYDRGYGKGALVEQLVRHDLAKHGITSMEDYIEWERKGDRRIQIANNEQRYNMTKAYVLHTSIVQPIVGETNKEYEKRYAQYVSDQMKYITWATDAQYGYLLGSQYQDARLYAEIMAYVYSGKQETIEWSENGKQISFDLAKFGEIDVRSKSGGFDKLQIIAAYRKKKHEQKAGEISQMCKLEGCDVNEKQLRQYIAREILTEAQDSLYKLDGRIVGADFEGVAAGERAGEALARRTSSDMIIERLGADVKNLLAKSKTEGIGCEDYENVIGAVVSICEEPDVLEFQRIGRTRRFRSRLFSLKQTDKMLSLQYILDKVS